MADPAPIPPSADHIDQELMVGMATAAAVRAMEQVGLPLSIGLDGQSESFGSAAEGIQTAERFLKLLQLQREMEAQARPYSLSQVVRG